MNSGLRSMTGYSRHRLAMAGGEVLAEVHSLNHKHADVAISLPPGCTHLDVGLRKTVRRRVGRGRVRIQISLTGREADAGRLQVHWDRVEQYLEASRNLAENHGLTQDLGCRDLLLSPTVVEVVEDRREDAALDGSVQEAIEGALEGLITMQKTEGAHIGKDLSERLTMLETLLGQIKERAGAVPGEQRRQLESRLERLQLEVPVPEERLAQELVLYAERADVTEEIVRLESHFEQARQILESGGEIGLKLDFLCQEFGREINTIGTKAADARLGRCVVEFKAEVAKIREQAHNLV